MKVKVIFIIVFFFIFEAAFLFVHYLVDKSMTDPLVIYSDNK